MKALLIAAAAMTGVLACAQSCPAWSYNNYGYGYGGYTYLMPTYTTAPQIIYLGGRNTASHRESNVPFAYGSFFYGQSWSDWQRSQRRH